jgi:2-acylglycerol O-acyltransferase 2
MEGRNEPWLRVAPLNIPLERRLQTAALLATMMLLPGTIAFVFAMAFFPPFVRWYSRELLIMYLIWWFFFDRKTPSRGGRHWFWLRTLSLWRRAADYFPANLVIPKNAYRDAKQPLIFCIHPHGVISMGAIFTMLLNAEEAKKKIGENIDYRIATVSFNVNFPLWRDLLLALGFINASRSSIRWCLEKEKKSVGIVIGGAEETLYSQPGSADLVLGKRKGFCRLALKTGASLVPVYSFGEAELYSQAESPWLRKLQLWAIKVTGFTIPLIRGRGIFFYDFGVLPQRRPLNTVMGEPIAVEKWIPPADAAPHADPPAELVDALHNQYIEALKKLYDAHREKYSKPVDARGRPIEQKPLRIVA